MRKALVVRGGGALRQAVACFFIAHSKMYIFLLIAKILCKINSLLIELLKMKTTIMIF